MSVADVFLLLGGILLLAGELIALQTATPGDTISERLRNFVKAHPIAAGTFILFSIWFPLHILEVVP
jgi:hypothetical protein